VELVNYPKVNIILLNYNGWRDTIECLESLQNITYPNYKLIVVDNDSKDNSLLKIKSWSKGNLKINTGYVNFELSQKPLHYIEYTKKEAEKGGAISKEKEINKLSSSKKLVLIESGENLGFASGNNIGIKYSLATNADYITLLNNDTVVDKNFLESLVKTIRSKNNIGMVSGKIINYSNPNEILFSGGKIDLFRGSGYHFTDDRFNSIAEVSFLSGCLWLINPKLIEDIGFMDENYFLYLEDTDYCYRAVNAGYKLIYNPNSLIYHKEGNTTGKLSSLSIYYSSRNRPYFVHKNSNSIFIIIIFWLFYIPTRIIKSIILGKKGKMIYKGIKDFLKICFKNV
jgi:GT2 family glycosyltransferase